MADVQDSYSNINNAGSFNGKPSVLIVIFRQPGANIIATVDRVIAAMPFLQASLPPSIKLQVGLDRTTTVRASVADVQRTLIISVLLVVLVVFVFLREVRATLIPSVAVPLAIVGTFGIMYLFGYSLDNLSLMALTISTGFVVDDAIVVLENVMRHIEAGMKPYQAALLGAREIGFTVVSMSTLADGRVHPDSADGRARRATVPRICRHAERCHCGLDGGVADDHADAVRAFLEAARSRRATACFIA